MYQFVGSKAEINDIKNAGGRWIEYRNGKRTNVVIQEHVDAGDFITGWYKTVRTIKNSDGKIERRARYFRRVGVKNEI